MGREQAGSSNESGKPRRYAGWLVGAVAVAAVAGIVSHLATAPPQIVAGLPGAASPASNAAFNELLPLLERAEQANFSAKARAVQVLHERFDRHRAGIPVFVDDVSGWGTRFGVIGRFTADAWHHAWGDGQADAVHEYIDGKFRGEVLDDAGLRQDVRAVLEQLRDDLAANRNTMLAQIKVQLKASRLPVRVDEPALNAFNRDVMRRSSELTASMGGGTVADGLAGFVGGTIAQLAAEQVIQRILAMVGTEVAADAAVAATAEGSATAGGAAAGGGIGSFGGPAGTIVGVGVGFIVGGIVDWWMTDQFKARLTQLTTAFLNDVEKKLLEGDANSKGMDGLLYDAVRQYNAVQRRAVFDATNNNLR